jgi:hypothetical protein
MADVYRTTGSDGVVERFIDKGTGTGTQYWSRAMESHAAPYPVSPVMTLYTPTTTNYVKVTPNAANLAMFLAPSVATETLTVASIVVHKIADVTTLSATNPATNDTTELYALADEVMEDFITHLASTSYHVTATGTITHTNATSEATAIAEVNLIRTNQLSHFASTTAHGGKADAAQLALVTATAACTTKAEAVTLINLLATYHLAHLAVTDVGAYYIHPAAVMPMQWNCLGSFFCKTSVSNHSFSTVEFRSA